MQISVTIAHNDFAKMVDGFKDRLHSSASKGLDDVGQHVTERIKKLIKDPPKTGRKYPSLPNRSSAPGESPANQSGKLMESVKYKVSSWNLLRVGDTVKYGKFLEFNLRRPHVSTAVDQTMETAKMLIDIAIREGIKIDK